MSGPRRIVARGPQAPQVPAWAPALLAWYAAHQRAFPWRGTRDPWAVLVSEVMLQQTQTGTVSGRFGAFLREFPTPEALAEASERRVLGAWAGLGYYRRARALQAAARTIVKGGWPSTAEGLRALPGVGVYTANAVAAIAWSHPLLPIDGNVDRVASRLMGLQDASPACRRRQIARALAVPQPAGDFVQALFDLGAEICSPRRPGCDRCPLAGSCEARRTGRVAEIPPPKKRAKRPVSVVIAAFDSDGTRVRLQPSQGPLLGGLWALPHEEGSTESEATRALRRRFSLGPPLVRYHHAFSHREWRVVVRRARLRDRAASAGLLRRHSLSSLPPLPTAWQKAFDAIAMGASGGKDALAASGPKRPRGSAGPMRLRRRRGLSSPAPDRSP